ncbi:MAG: MBL fold metallo-hydrolase [Aureliella sp.]
MGSPQTGKSKITPMSLLNLRFLNSGYCLQFERLTGVRSWRVRRFEAVFLHFKHPLHGECLIDTGYGPANWQQLRRLPWCLLWPLTPIPIGQTFGTSAHLRPLGIDPEAIQLVFISHFHPDHVGGTRLFPAAKFVYRAQSFRELNSMPIRKQLRAAFIPGLLPPDFTARSLPISESQFSLPTALSSELRSLDYFGDSSLIWLDLPGHALGHSGFILKSRAGPTSAASHTTLYATDAFWDRRTLIGGSSTDRSGSPKRTSRRLPWLTRLAIHNYTEYQQTQQRLLRLSATLAVEPLACHCPATQAYVTQPTH